MKNGKWISTKDAIDETTPLLVSIRCMVYNHGPYLRQCLDGFVKQQTSFRFEAIVHDDASTDDSASIIREYAEKYPEIIKPLYEEKNLYSVDKHELHRKMDEACIGKYVATCEGDDYWIDPLKLQKQVDFMESHPDCSMCITAYYNKYGEELVERRVYNEDVEICSMEDIIRQNGSFFSTASIVYRRECFTEYPEWTKNAPVGDIPMLLVLAARGNVAYINEIMNVYRRNSTNSWSQRISKNVSYLVQHRVRLNKMWEDYDEWTSRKYHKYIGKSKRKMNRQFDRLIVGAVIRKLTSFIKPRTA